MFELLADDILVLECRDDAQGGRRGLIEQGGNAEPFLVAGGEGGLERVELAVDRRDVGMGAAVQRLLEVPELPALGACFGKDGCDMGEGDTDGVHDLFCGLLDGIGHREKYALLLWGDTRRFHAKTHHEDAQGDVTMGEVALDRLGVLQSGLDLKHLLLLRKGDAHARVDEVDRTFVELVGGF